MDKEKWEYNFPAYKDIPIDAVSQVRQFRKISEEWNEAITSWHDYKFNSMNQDDYVMELMDIIHACETLLREFEQCVVDDCKKKVINKNAERGYYDDLRA